MTEFITTEALTALFQVVLIDLVLAGDNAIVVGMAAAGLPARQRHRVILAGIAAATVLRILFAGAAMHLLEIIGLTLAGGILLLWVSWKMYREIRAGNMVTADAAVPAAAPCSGPKTSPATPGSIDPPAPRRKTTGQAMLQVVLADVSMSLDNVLAVAGAAREHPYILAFGLLLSVALMGVAADLLGRVLQKQRWIGYVGLAIIVYVAFEMIYRGSLELAPVIASL